VGLQHYGQDNRINLADPSDNFGLSPNSSRLNFVYGDCPLEHGRAAFSNSSVQACYLQELVYLADEMIGSAKCHRTKGSVAERQGFEDAASFMTMLNMV